MNLKGATNAHLGRHEFSKRSYLKAIEIRLGLNDKDAAANTFTNLSVTYAQNGETKKALEALESGLELRRETGNLSKLADSQNAIGSYYFSYLNDYNKALIHFEKAIELYIQTNTINASYYTAVSNKATTLCNLTRFDEALSLLKSIENDVLLENNHMTILNFHHSLGALYLLKKDWKQSEESYLIALKMANNIEHKLSTAKLNSELSQLYTETLNLKKFKYHDSLALNTYKALDNNRGQLMSLELNYKFYKNSNDYTNALIYLEQHNALKDSLDIRNKEADLKQITAQFESNEKDLEISTLKYEKEKSKLTIYFSIILIVLIIISAVLFILRQHKLKEKDKLVYQQSQELLKAEKKLKNSELEKATSKINIYTKNLLEKNALIDELNSKINKQDSDLEQTLSENKKIVADLSNQKILTENDWDKFKRLFQDAYPGYLMKLRQDFEEISVAEERHFILLTLKMTSDKTSEVLGISKDSVRKSKYRLKKRLNIDQNDKLEAFILEYSKEFGIQ